MPRHSSPRDCERRIAPLSHGLGFAALGLLLIVSLACTSLPDAKAPLDSLADRTGHALNRPAGIDFALPADVDLADGLSEDEAIGIALWNSAAFRIALADLEAARTDVQQAGLLSNPILTLQFPVGAKQFEGTLGWAVEALLSRGPRVEAERHRWEGVASRLVETGLEQVRQVRSAFIDAWLARETSALAKSRSALSRRMAAIANSRSRDGELSELQASNHATAALLDRADAESALRLSQDRVALLGQLIGWEGPLDSFEIGAPRALPPSTSLDELTQRAELRPEIRAAQNDIEAAAHQLGWEKRRIVRFTAILDANGSGGGRGFEIGPGLGLELPIFDRNQAGIARAESGIERAAWAYLEVRRRVRSEVARTHAAALQSQEIWHRWNGDVLPAVERAARLAQETAQRGAISYADAALAELRLLDARVREAELQATLHRSIAELERSVGARLDEE